MRIKPPINSREKPLLVIVTGLSGAGLSTAIKALEDSGAYCIDNLPVEMVGSAVDLILAGKIPALFFAFGMDIRDKRFAGEFPLIMKNLREKVQLDVAFLQADEEVIATRYGSSRRRHPLLQEGGDIGAAAKTERDLLTPVHDAADVVFDTSNWSPHSLARAIESRYSNELPMRHLYVTITSFGFKNGLYRQIDSLFDARFVNNPHFVPKLKDKTGLDSEVQDFIFDDPKAKEYFEKIERLHRFLLPLYFQEGKHYFRIGIGCTGGKHRSVCIADRLARSFIESPLDNIVVTAIHRDI